MYQEVKHGRAGAGCSALALVLLLVFFLFFPLLLYGTYCTTALDKRRNERGSSEEEGGWARC